MSDEIKDMLQAILGRLDEQGAEMKAIREDVQSIRKEMSTKVDVEELREDIHTLIELYGEQQHEVRKLKRKVKEDQ
ncbi:hypothetical protein [Paludifilum halophilum]|uniref:Uncharacterized protein n=1 Tax=Paludifilum halophilum TaxID=1642702 RepID=A0A235BA56_9BACL|nr:hypothetical protein [Paludifilum halophilum]OYD08767.1 hypothetical protein CHM34_02925 [Paludifilum halophilum]